MARAIAWIGLGIMLAAAGTGWSASAQQSAPGFAGVSARELVTNFQAPANGPMSLTIVDPQTRVLAVYHIARETGEIQLKSVRNINGDLMLVDFNTGSPSPVDIRKMIDQQQ